jgi:hypothetical protein
MNKQYIYAAKYLNLMRKILYLIIIVTTSLSARAQDISKWSKWTSGCYYDTTGKKICGLIKWSIPQRSILKGDGDRILFKDSLNGARQKIHTNQMRAFVINSDSLVVSHADDLSDYPILWVALNNNLKLYVCLRENNSSSFGVNGLGMSYSSIDRRYYFGPDPDIVVELTRGKFIEVMSSIIADDTELVGAIKNKTYRYGDIDDVIKKYKAFREIQKTTPDKR